MVPLGYPSEWVRPFFLNATKIYNTYSYNTSIGMANGTDAHFSNLNITNLNVTGITNINHNNLIGLQGGGGEGSEYYHLNLNVWDMATSFLDTAGFNDNTLSIGSGINLLFSYGNVTTTNGWGVFGNLSVGELNVTGTFHLGTGNITFNSTRGIHFCPDGTIIAGNIDEVHCE